MDRSEGEVSSCLKQVIREENSTPPRRDGLFKDWPSLAGTVFAVSSVFSCLFLFATELFLPPLQSLYRDAGLRTKLECTTYHQCLTPTCWEVVTPDW